MGLFARLSWAGAGGVREPGGTMSHEPWPRVNRSTARYLSASGAYRAGRRFASLTTTLLARVERVLLWSGRNPYRAFVGRRKNPNLPVERPRPGQCPLTGGASHLEAGPGPAVIVR